MQDCSSPLETLRPVWRVKATPLRHAFALLIPNTQGIVGAECAYRNGCLELALKIGVPTNSLSLAETSYSSGSYL